MKILTVNAGSSSLKFNMIKLPEKEELISGNFEKIGLAGGIYSIKINGSKIKKEADMRDHKDAIELLIKELFDNDIIKSLDEIDGIGHRLVHGGDKYASSVVIDDDVLHTVGELSSLAPLHNPANILGVEAFREALPNVPMVGVFDTAFHQTMGEEQYLYSVPLSWYKDYQIRKYGFHGTSHKYILKTMQEKLGRDNLNLISCHIGSGASICAIKDGKSFDTTMGFTPNAGLIMGTRSGDIDASILEYMNNKTGKSVSELTNELNKKSGLLGVSGISSDSRDVEQAALNGNPRAILAQEMYAQKIANYIAMYNNLLNGADVITLTAGVGENSKTMRKMILDRISSLGVKIDEEKNDFRGELRLITTDDSKIPVYVVPTDEELMIALDTMELALKNE